MKSLVSHAAQVLVFLSVVLVALPANAGGGRSKAATHKGHSVSHHGVARINLNSRSLPNGVSIFNRNSKNLPNGVSIFNRPSHAPHAPIKMGSKRKHTRNSHSNVNSKSKSRHKIKEHKHAKNDGGRRGWKKRSKRKHKYHKKRRVIYANTVYIAAPPDEYIYPEYGDEENCRHLTERGYDRAGRRVLVEWTLCFDEQGTAYVPAEGRPILAHY